MWPSGHIYLLSQLSAADKTIPSEALDPHNWYSRSGHSKSHVEWLHHQKRYFVQASRESSFLAFIHSHSMDCDTFFYLSLEKVNWPLAFVLAGILISLSEWAPFGFSFCIPALLILPVGSQCSCENRLKSSSSLYNWCFLIPALFMAERRSDLGSFALWLLYK